MLSGEPDNILRYEDFTEEIKLTVKNGAYWLDENHPGWEEKLDLSLLEMQDCAKCVIGQAVGNYLRIILSVVTGTVFLHATNEEINRASEWALVHGFEAPLYLEIVDDRIRRQNQLNYYHILDTLWTDEVQWRLG